jgi:hypothetical protein
MMVIWGASPMTVLWGASPMTVLWGASPMTVLWGASPMTVLWDATPYDGYMGSRIGQMQYSFAPPRTNAVQFWVSGTTTIELTYRTDLPFGR